MLVFMLFQLYYGSSPFRVGNRFVQSRRDDIVIAIN